MSSELESRVEVLERQLSAITKLNGIPGPQGKPGNIVAAVANAEKVVDDKMASLFERVDTYAKQEGQYRKESIESLRRDLDQFRTEMKQAFSDFQASDKVRLQNLVVEVLAEYAVVSSHDNRVIQA
jgi:polyhydroxyalkanoate synthesis regulator phasin